MLYLCATLVSLVGDLAVLEGYILELSLELGKMYRQPLGRSQYKKRLMRKTESSIAYIPEVQGLYESQFHPQVTFMDILDQQC